MKRTIMSMMLAAMVLSASGQNQANHKDNADGITATINEQTKVANMEEVQAYLKECGTFYIATNEGDQPRVRPFSSVAEFENKAYLCSGKQKEIYLQIKNNPKVELSGMYDGGTWLRVSATLLEDDRIEAQQAVLDDPTGPSQLYHAGDGRFVVYRLENVKAFKYNFYAAPEEIKDE